MVPEFPFWGMVDWFDYKCATLVFPEMYTAMWNSDNGITIYSKFRMISIKLNCTDWLTM